MARPRSIMDTREAIEFAVEEAIADARQHSPPGAGDDVEMLTDMAASKFNRLADDTGTNFGITLRDVLEAKCEAEVEKQLGIRGDA